MAARYRQVAAITALLLCVALIAGCATAPSGPKHPLVYLPPLAASEPLAQYAPAFVPAFPQRPYNRIGRSSVRSNDRGAEEIYVDPNEAVVYARQRDFATAKGHYTNLIYRVHFEKVPFSLFPFYLTAGRNGGLLVIVTLNDRQQPVLITTVHTCGCYLAFVPTSYLSRTAYPPDWDVDGQTVFGARLPGRIDYPEHSDENLRLVFFTEHATHRIVDIGLARVDVLANGRRVIHYRIAPAAALERLPLDGGTTSFFNTEGFRKGYVKDTFKPFELLLMSWWALDINVGTDKQYGPAEQTGTRFYTSLKPWRRKESDMWEFARFLDYWGWKL